MADYSMANRKIAYTLGRGRAYIFDMSSYQNLGSGSWYQVACRVPNVACHAVSIPFVSKSSVSCRVINLRVGVSVPCRSHREFTPCLSWVL